MTELLQYIFIVLIGLIFGSFYACLVMRYLFSQALFSSRSKCLHCHKVLSARQLIPLLSYLLQKGRCKNCHTPLSFFYFFIESLTCITSVLLYSSFGFGFEFFFYFMVTGVLIMASCIDYKVLILPDNLTLGASAFLLPFGLASNILPFWPSILGGFFAFLLLYGLYWYYKTIRQKEVLGFGDIKYIILLGTVVGIDNIPYLLLIASISGILFCIVTALIKKSPLWQTLIPFGPFLSFACFVLML